MANRGEHTRQRVQLSKQTQARRRMKLENLRRKPRSTPSVSRLRMNEDKLK